MLDVEDVDLLRVDEEARASMLRSEHILGQVRAVECAERLVVLEMVFDLRVTHPFLIANHEARPLLQAQHEDLGGQF